MYAAQKNVLCRKQISAREKIIEIRAELFCTGCEDSVRTPAAEDNSLRLQDVVCPLLFLQSRCAAF